MTTLLAQYGSNTATMPPGVAAAAAGMFGIVAFIGLIATVVAVACYYMIAKRAGYNPLLALLAFIPLVNFIMILIFAFSEWPVQRENRLLRAQLAGGGTPTSTGFGDASSGYLPGRGPLPPAST